jgi:hypothetical protein
MRRRIVIGLAALVLLATGCTWDGRSNDQPIGCGIDSQGREYGNC